MGSDHDNQNNIFRLSAFWGLEQVLRSDFWGPEIAPKRSAELGKDEKRPKFRSIYFMQFQA